MAVILGRTVGVGGVVTHEVCYTGVIGRLKERSAVPHILGSLGGQNQASAHSPTRQARPRCAPAPVSPHHLVLGLPLLHQVPLVPGLQFDWHRVGIQGLGSP